MAYDDIESIATRMVANYGDGAVKILTERSRRLRRAGQLDDAVLWSRVADAALVLLHPKRPLTGNDQPAS